MAGITGVSATFSNLNIKSGKAVLQFELSQTDAKLLPDLAAITGEPVSLDISTAQQQLVFADAEAIEYASQDAAQPVLALGA